MRIIGAIAILTLASACGTTAPTASPTLLPTVVSSPSSTPTTTTTTTTSTTPTIEPVPLPVDLAGRTAAAAEQQLRTLGFTVFRYLDRAGKQVILDPSWTVVSIDGAGFALRPDAEVVMRVDKPAPPPPPKTTPKVTPKPAPPAPPKPPTQDAPPPPVAGYYKNCDAARAAGVAPLYRGEPGYRSALDRDDDGIACE